MVNIKEPLLIEIISNSRGKYLMPDGYISYKKIEENHLNPLNKQEESIYSRYVMSAKKRNKDFRLTKHFFKHLINSPCTYCFTSINKCGVDRLDNTKGYIYSNSVPCCSICNRAKHKLGFAEFDNWLENLASNYKKHKDTPKINPVDIGLRNLNSKDRAMCYRALIKEPDTLLRLEKFKITDVIITRKDYREYLKNKGII